MVGWLKLRSDMGALAIQSDWLVVNSHDGDTQINMAADYDLKKFPVLFLPLSLAIVPVINSDVFSP